VSRLLTDSFHSRNREKAVPGIVKGRFHTVVEKDGGLGSLKSLLQQADEVITIGAFGHKRDTGLGAELSRRAEYRIS
jgi:hypothetical protein